MVLRNSAIYLAARLAQSSIVFATVILYTRLLTPEEYGSYALVLSVVAMVNGLTGQWLYSATLRLTARATNESAFVSTVNITYGFILAFVAFACVVVFFTLDDPTYRRLLLLGLALLCVNGIFDLNLNLLVARLQSTRFALLSIVRAASAALIGAVLAYVGWGEAGVLSGAIIGAAVPGLSLLRRELRHLSFRLFDRAVFREILTYGLPLSIGLVLSSVTTNSDRLLLAAFSDVSAVGLYTAAIDIANRIILALMTSIGNAAFSQTTHELEYHGPDAAQQQSRDNFIFLIAIGLPAAIGLAVVASQLSALAVGVEFRDSVTAIIPLAAMAAFLNNLRSHYFDHAFQLGRQTGGLVAVMGVAAIAAVALNVLLIPAYGALGAAYAMLIVYALSLPICIGLGRRAFALPVPFRDAGKICLAAVVMGAVVYFMPDDGSFGLLILRIGTGGCVYVGLIALTLPDLRRNVSIHLRRRRPDH